MRSQKKRDNFKATPKWIFVTKDKHPISADWITQVEHDYEPNDDIFCEDSEKFRRLKHLICNKLNETERRIILAYTELGNLRDTAKLFRVSTTTIYKEIKKIREKIKNERID